MSKKVSILGLGWLGLPLAMKLHNEGYVISGSTTTLDKMKTLSEQPFQVSRIYVDTNTILGDWESFMHQTDILIINFPPKRIANIETIHPKQIEEIIKRTPKSTKVIFVSSTSVYQNTNSLIDESVTCLPEKASGIGLIEAENLLKAHFDKNLTILRLAGLIGPKRHPGRFLANKKQLKNPNVPVNLIHQKDCIGLIKEILVQDCFGETLNGCADIHPKRKDFYENAALELKLPPPVFETQKASDYKIIDNSKSKSILNFKYEFSNPEWIFSRKA